MAPCLPPPLLRQIVKDLGRTGRLDVSSSFGLVQIVSFSGRFPAVIEEARAALDAGRA